MVPSLDKYLSALLSLIEDNLINLCVEGFYCIQNLKFNYESFTVLFQFVSVFFCDVVKTDHFAFN